MSLFEDIDLGADEYSGKKESAFDSLVSKPIQRKYQPFGGPMPQAPQQQQEPIDYGYEVQPTYQNNVFDESDAYGQLKKAHGQYKQFASENKRSADHYEDLYDDFVKNEFQPFFDEVGGFGDFKNDDDRIAFVDQMYADEVKASEEDDGFFGGPSKRKLAAQENLKKYQRWSNPNGLKDKFLRLKAEKDRRRKVADAAGAQEFQLFEQLTSIPIPAREALDERIKAKSKAPMSKARVDEMLDQQNWEAPRVNFATGEISNLEKTDPRKSLNLPTSFVTGKAQKSTEQQSQRLASAIRGDMDAVLAKRNMVRQERNLRDKGVMFSSNGLIDGRPIGMSRRDVDLLDIGEMRKAGFTEYQGKPLEQAFQELGGEERYEMAKILESVYAAKSNFEDAQLKYLKVAGKDASEKELKAMEQARDTMQQVIGLAASKGLDNELFEQAESVGWFSALGNAIKRGGLMSEMSDYSDDFLTNTLTADEMQNFIDAATEIEKLPGSGSLERYKKAVGEKASGGILSAIGRLLFDHPDAIPELFAESMASFLPATIKALIPSVAAGAGTGAAIGTAVAPGAGTLLGAKTGAIYGARASWGVASFVLEASGVALEGMQELGIDWKNPKVFAAAWTNESIRNKIQDKMVKKGLPIAIADAMTGMVAGNVMGVVNHTGKAMFQGGKLIDKAAWNASKGSVPRFTALQRTRNAAAEIGTDSTLGMAGEFLGQWAAKEPGEAWDWDAIAAEGVVGIGPGIGGAAFEAMGPGARYFGNAPIIVSGEQQTETGTTGTVDRAGYTAQYNTFNTPEDMMGYFRGISDNEESLAFTERFLNIMYRARPEAMAQLKIAISPRTPASNLSNRGSFEAKDGHVIMYLNENEFNGDPMGTFFHEAGHFARLLMFDKPELEKIYDGLKPEQKLEAYTQYYTKDFAATFEGQTEAKQKEIQRAFRKTDDDVLAEEWFSYQFARVLTTNFKPDSSVSKAVKTAKDKVFRPLFAEFVGTENLSGDKKGDDIVLDTQILEFVKTGLTPSMKGMIEDTATQIKPLNEQLSYENKTADEMLTEGEKKPVKREIANLKKQLQEKLQMLGLPPEMKAQAAKALNAMLGADILTTTVSFYQKPGLLQQAASRDPEEPENREVEKEIIGKVGQAYGKKKAQKTIVEFEGERPKADPEPDIKTENEALNPQIRRAQEKLTKAQQLPETSDAQKKNKAKAVKRYQADLNRLLQKGASQNKELVTEKESESRRQKRMAPGKKKKDPALKVKTRKEEQETYVRAETTKKDLKKVKVKERDTVEFKGKQAVEKRLDLLIPKTQEGRVALQKSLNTLKRVKKVVSNAKTLEAEIGKAAKKLGANASYASILAEILQLETLVDTSPISLLGEIRKEVNPTSRRKVPSSEDIEGILVGIRQKIDDINDQLDNRINEIDRELRDLRKGLETVEKPAEINRNIKELENLKTMARQYKALVAPEENTIDWTNTLHPKLLYAPAKLDEKGEPILDRNGMKIPKNKDQGMKRFTFGELATMKDFKRVVVYFQKTYKNDPKQHSRYYGQKPSHALWDYLTNTENIKSLQSYADKKDNEAFKYQNSEGKEFTLVAGEMLARIYAAKSAALVRPQKEIGNQPITTDSRQVFYPDSYKMEEEANIASVIAEGIRRVVKDARAKNKVSKLPIHSVSPTAVEMLTLSMISDRIAESIGVPANRKENLDKQIYMAERNEQARKITSDRIEAYPGIDGKPEKGLPRKDREDADNELEEQFDYAEKDDLEKEFQEKIQMGMPVQKALAEVTDAKLKRDFYEDYFKYQLLDAQMQDPTTGKGIEIPESGVKTSVDLKSKDNLLPEQTRGAEKGTGQLLLTSIMDEAASPKDYINRLRRYIEVREANGENKKVLEYLYDHLAKVKKASEALDRNRQQAFYAMRNLILSGLTSSAKSSLWLDDPALDDLGLYVPVSDTLASITADASFGPDFVKQEALQTPGLEVPPRKSYTFRKPFSSVADKIAATDEHGEFTAAQIYKTFDILKNYSLKQIKLSKSPPPVFKGYKKERTTLGETEKLRDYPTGMDKAQYDELSSTDINPAELANYYLKGKSPAEQMKKLAAVPSSKYGSETIKQDFGGLGEGFAPLVFVDMIRTFYKDLEIKEGTNKELLDALEKNILKQAAATATKPAYLIKTSALDAFKKQMAEVAKPIVQAVIDAEGVDVYGTYNPNKDNVLQYDPLEKPTKFDEEGNEVETTSKESGDIIDPSTEGSIPPRKNMKKTIEALSRAVREGKVSKEAATKKFNAYYHNAKELFDGRKGPEKPITLESIVKDKLKGKSPEELRKIQKEMESGMTEDFKKVQLAKNLEGVETELNSLLGSNTLTSDADVNLGKATIFAKMGGDSEYAKKARDWYDAKKKSIKDGSFKMNYVDRADPLKQFHRSLFDKLKELGFDEKSKLYNFLNLHGKYHQYFGKGYETVEQAQLKFIEPIKDLMRKYGVTQATFGEYLLARQAPSRNKQFEMRADEAIDAAAEEFGLGSKEHKEQIALYKDEKGNFKLTSGIDTDIAIQVLEEMESEPKFLNFLNEALPIYYEMQLQSLQNLQQFGLIGKDDVVRMKAASSHHVWENSKVKLHEAIGNYSYSPMQGFRGETEQFFDGEAAWDDFGMSGNSSGKGLDQPKSVQLSSLKGAFGRHPTQKGPDPEVVFATSINQFFDSAIRAHKNEVAAQFGEMYEFLQRLLHPKEAAKEKRGKKETLADSEESPFQDLQTKIDNMKPDEKEAFLKPLRKEFNKIFEPRFVDTETKKMYDFEPKPDNEKQVRMVTKVLSRRFQDKATFFTYRVNGEPRMLEFKQTPEGLAMADTLKNLRYESLPSVLNITNKITRGMAQMFTSMNPAFLIPNFFRDLATAAIHLTEDHKKVLLKDTIKGIGKAFTGVFKAERMIAKKMNPSDIKEVARLMDLDMKELAKSDHKLAPIARYQKAKQFGSKIGYFRHDTITETIVKINNHLKEGNKALTGAKKSAKYLADFVDNSNTAIENSIRISSFWAAIKNGFTEDEAAVIARNVTVDFNQKGNLTQAFGSLYVFFGASMNSAHRFVTSWKRRTPEERAKMFGGIIAASIVIALVNRLLDDDEEEEMPDYDKISTYKRDTHAILPIPAGMPEFFNDENDTGYFSMPLPLGYNLFWTIGQVAADWIAASVFDRGGTGLIGGTTRVASSVMNAFNPIGGSTIATMGMPTFITPMVELYANKNFMGNAIRYPDRPFETPKPAHMQDPKGTPEHWNDLSKFINEFMGGSDQVKGSVKGMFGANPLLSSEDDLNFDMSGNQMKHLFYGYLGGPGQIFDFALGSLYSGKDGSSIKNINQVPVFNRFIRATTYGSATRDMFYGIREVVKNAETAVKGAQSAGPQLYNAVRRDNLPLLKLSAEISAFDKKKNKLNRLKKEVENSKRLTEEQKTQRVDEIQKQELDLMTKIIKRAQGLGIR